MTPQEKAKELVKKFDNLLPCEGTTTGQTPIDCALIVVEEIFSLIKGLEWFKTERYWNEVKAEIEKL
jgi:hypothetical protein